MANENVRDYVAIGDNFSSLKRKRGAVKHKLTCFKKYLNDVDVRFVNNEPLDSKCIAELRIRTNVFELINNEFEQIQNDIELVCPDDDLEIQYEERSSFFDNYVSLLAIAKNILKRNDNEHCSDDERQSSRGSSVHSDRARVDRHSFEMRSVKLPVIDLPKFNGNFKNWIEYKDTFESLIHTNKTINDIQKYHYLRSSLEGEALKTIQCLEFSSVNYEIAWNMVCERFNNQRLLTHNHIKAILELKVMTVESASNLRNLLDTACKHIKSLEMLQLPVQYWDVFLIYIVNSKLCRVTQEEWEKFQFSIENPTLHDMKTFLNQRAIFLETVEINKFGKKDKDQTHVKVRSLVTTNTKQKKCNFCKNNHSIYSCVDFGKLPVNERLKSVESLNLCSNCLCTGHSVNDCKAKFICKVCAGKHNTLIHQDESNSVPAEPQVSLSIRETHEYVLLSTAVVNVADAGGNVHRARALLDSGSQSNFMTKDLRDKLNLKRVMTDTSVVGINQISSKLKYKCNVRIESNVNTYSTEIPCFIIDKVTDNLPAISIDIKDWNIPDTINLADPNFNHSNQVDLLLGAAVFWDVLTNQTFNLGKNKPTLQNTKLGWVAAGVFSTSFRNRIHNLFAENQCDNFELRKFWELENVNDEQDDLSVDEKECEQHFLDTFDRNDDGRFIVRMPFKHPTNLLGDSKQFALKRFLNLEKRFRNDDQLKKFYSDFIDEYLRLGHMSPTPNNLPDDTKSYFLPHHAVWRLESLTTKLRVVFDGSAATTSGWSLNSLQYIGKPYQNEIFSILLRFRKYKFIVCADIQKMYRQILINPNDRPLQQILWRNSENEEISCFMLNTVTYGIASAPYLALRCLLQIAVENQREFPIASNIIQNDFYVDDLITGFDNEEQAIKICNDVSFLLEKSCFKLTKWFSNSRKITNEFCVSNNNMVIQKTKTLGMSYDTDEDTLSFNFGVFEIDTGLTKRKLLSEISKLYDPLGLISPCIVLMKILIQRLWTQKIDWDDVVPDDIKEKWIQFGQNISYLNSLKISRNVICENGNFIELHGFCDASKDAYAAVIYLRSIFNDNRTVHLLCSKTRVSPLKQLSTPRLELCGAVLLSQLMKRVLTILEIKDINYYLWCDSQVVLTWINCSIKSLSVFVANRVNQIRQNLDSRTWSYINTKENPADLASRGVMPKKLARSNLWWNGPDFLLEDKSSWPKLEMSNNLEIPELKVFTNIDLKYQNSSWLIHKFSSLLRLKRTFAYVLRFIFNLKAKGNGAEKRTGSLTVEELSESLIKIITLAQEDDFKSEKILLKNNKQCSSKSKIISLSPFLDQNNLIRVGGRLKNSNLPYHRKHPILMDGKHHLTHLIFLDMHKKLFHAGPQLLLSSIRQDYWPTAGMNLAKKITRSCVQCFKSKPKYLEAVMGDLPRSRISLTTPFSTTGVDYGGPYLIKDKRGRNFKLSKAYICVFICFTFKAIHLELVADLTSECFIAALRRFVSRRGKPSYICSDNATNFTASNKELKCLYDFLLKSSKDICDMCANENIKWSFIPPKSPHFGGIWESAIKSVKGLLSKVIGNNYLTFDEFYTLLTQIEAALNSRPMYAMSSDANDLQPLTPSHFLIGKPLISVPDPNLLQIKQNKLSRYQLLQQMYQSFWKRWSQDYFCTLQQRNKWRITKQPNVQVGDLVLLKNDALPPCKWSIGRVSDVHAGKDGVVRVVSVKTISGTFKRALPQICLLPLPKHDV